MGTFIGTIITGAIIGALARFFMRGRQNISILCGAVGAAIGTWAATQLGVADTSGIDWIRWIISIIAAMLTISLYMGLTGKK